MNINKYTEKAQEAILAAQQLADREGHPEILPEHLLLTLLEQKEGIVPEIVRKMNAGSRSGWPSAVRAELNRLPRAHGGSQLGLLRAPAAGHRPPPSRKPSGSRTSTSSTEHLFVAIAAEGGRSPASRAPPAARHHEGHDPPGDDERARLAARHQPEPREPRTSRSSATAATSPSSRARASSIRSSAATTRFAA